MEKKRKGEKRKRTREKRERESRQGKKLRQRWKRDEQIDKEKEGGRGFRVRVLRCVCRCVC